MDMGSTRIEINAIIGKMGGRMLSSSKYKLLQIVTEVFGRGKIVDQAEAFGLTRGMAYDMTNGWVYHFRLFDEEEKSTWEEVLSKVLGEDDDNDYVGAQWDAKKAKEHPPAVFEKNITYRPIMIKKSK